MLGPLTPRQYSISSSPRWRADHVTLTVAVYPAETEEVLLTVDGTDEIAVVGIPHERWREAVHAVVTLRSGTGPEAWEHDARTAVATLASYKRPKSYAVVDALPRSHSGKVLKREIREPYWADVES